MIMFFIFPDCWFVGKIHKFSLHEVSLHELYLKSINTLYNQSRKENAEAGTTSCWPHHRC